MRTRRSSTLFILSLAVQIAVKLWLIHRHEIVACDSVLSFAVRALNYHFFGTFADHELAIPGFSDLNSALVRITPTTRVCQVPVPMEFGC